MKKAIVLAVILLVILILNIDRLLIIDDYLKATILIVIAVLLSFYEYKTGNKIS